jgi:hypothetical protein
MVGVMAVALAAWAVVARFDILPHFRAEWQRLVSALPSDHDREAQWLRALGLIGLLATVLVLLPPLPPRVRIIAFAVAALTLLLGALGASPRLRATCERWLAALGITSRGKAVRKPDALVMMADGSRRADP